MNATLGIAAVVTGSSLAFAAGMVWPDVRRRREPRPAQKVDESLTPPVKVVQLPPPAPEQLVRDLQLPAPAAAVDIAATVELDDGYPSGPTVSDEPAVARALTRAQRRSRRNSGGKRRKRHGRR